ncbi:MAG: hypothetical protein LBT59_01400 [Clostridiales bacterium]|jgi:hypothetical protein|nr:hypothetical protein [Clostridiales bacterium]
MNNHFAKQLDEEDEEFKTMYMEFEQFETRLEASEPCVCPWSNAVEKLALGVWDVPTCAHLSICKPCNLQYAMAKPLVRKAASAAKRAIPAKKNFVYKLPNPIKIGKSFGMPLLAMGDETVSVSRIPIPNGKGSLCLKAGADGWCQAWAEPATLSFELVSMKGNAVLSRVFCKPKQPLPSFQLTGAEKLSVKFDGCQMEFDLEQQERADY